MKNPRMVTYRLIRTCGLLSLLLLIVGCGPRLSTPEEIQKFEKAGHSAMDFAGLKEPLARTGPYQVAFGDILQFQMPTSMRTTSPGPTESYEKIEPFLCRVSEKGTITLPIVGEIFVAGKTLPEIESLVADAYYPKYVVTQPVVVCEVLKYNGGDDKVFTVLGLVNHPNAFPYPPGVRFSLMEALAFAGGLNMSADPRYVKVLRQSPSGEIVSAVFSVDSKSLIAAYKVTIKPGDVVYVDHTLQTRINKFLSDTLRINVGANYYPNND